MEAASRWRANATRVLFWDNHWSVVYASPGMEQRRGPDSGVRSLDFLSDFGLTSAFDLRTSFRVLGDFLKSGLIGLPFAYLLASIAVAMVADVVMGEQRGLQPRLAIPGPPSE